jgi:3-oxoacyl-[acyl-carrier-protein] synthase-3
MSLPLKIVGVGRYLPKRIVPSSEVERMCGLKDGWIERQTGVRERRWVNGESNSMMAAEAAREAIADAAMTWDQIDLILNASGTPEQAIPDMASLIQRQLGLGSSGIACMTIHATCLSFLVAVDIASTLIECGRYRNIMIVSADIASVALNYKEPESAALFGDAAGAVVVTRTPRGEGSALQVARLETYGEGANLTEIRGGGSRCPPNSETTTAEDNMFHMEGPKVYRLVRRYQDDFMENLRPGLSQGLGDIKLVIPHQASLLALRALRRNNIPDEQVMITLDRYGNCVASSLPITLYEAIKERRMERGDTVLLAGTGAGLSLGGIILTY